MGKERTGLTEILQMKEGYASSKVLTVAAKLGFLSTTFPPLTAEGFARACRVSPRGARLFLNALVSLGIFEFQGERYQLRGEIKRCLEEFPEMVNDLIHHDHLYEVWGERLEGGVRRGESIPPTQKEKDAYPQSLELFLRAMRAHASYVAQEWMGAVSWEGVTRFLDVGGGGGGYALAIARHVPHVTVTVADLPDAVEITKKMLASDSEGARIRFFTCNAYTDSLPEGPFDRILISHLIHLYPEKDNRFLLQKAAALLRTGGDLFLLDYFLDETETLPREAVLFRLLMMMGTPKGDCFRLSQAGQWLEEAGLALRKSIELRGGNTLLIATKERPKR